MDDSVFLSLELDPVIIDSIPGGLTSSEHGSTRIENTRDTCFDHTFYVVTSNNFDISSEVNASIAGNSFDMAIGHDLDQTINFVNLDRPDIENSYNYFNVRSGDIVDDTLDYEESPTTVTEFNFSDQPISYTNILNEVKSGTNKSAKSLLKVNSKKRTNSNNNVTNQDKLPTSLSECVINTHKVDHYFYEEAKSQQDQCKDSKSIWNCERCPGMRFPSKRQLQRHMAARHPPMPRRLPCPECAATFPLASRLKSHMLAAHSHYRPHKCQECGKAFFKAFDLKKHRNVHNGMKPYECVVCKKTFVDASNLKRHMLQHTFERPYKCETCGKRYQQLASLRRHQTESAAALLGLCGRYHRAGREYHCKTCGDKFHSKSSLVEHEIRAHQNNTGADFKLSHISDLGRNVDALIKDMLFEETEQRSSVYITQDNIVEDKAVIKKQPLEADAENSLEIELINEIHKIEQLANEPQLSSIDNNENTVEEFHIRSLFSENIDSPMNFNSFHSQSLLQTNNLNFESIPVASNVSSAFDLMTTTEIGQTENSNFESINIEKLPDELLNLHHEAEPEIAAVLDNNNFETQQVVVNECATIFESDVDLESSTNLAANLNQLIAENNVQFVSTEDDDTFIINLNSTIDAEQLSDLLNIGIEIVDQRSLELVNISSSSTQNTDRKLLIEETKEETIPVQETKENIRVKKKSPLYVCKICAKTFKKKDNFQSHIGTHNPKLSRHECEICKRRFSYRSTLNKHVAAAHEPRVWPCHSCEQCPKHYRAAWMLRCHQEREHAKLSSYRCTKAGCEKTFYKKSDFDYHQRMHSNIRPYKCALCVWGFAHASHLARHRRHVNCTRPRRKGKKGRASETAAGASAKAVGASETAVGASETAVGASDTAVGASDASTELLTDIDDLLMSKMSTVSP